MKNNHIQYIELQAIDLEQIKEFYISVFSWTFTDWGENYASFSNSGVEGGFAKVEKVEKAGPLVILYHSNLEEALESVKKAGGKISKEIFSFPGGKRFHFTDPSGNELAVWSDK